MPTDFERPALQTYNGNTINTWLAKETVYYINTYCLKNNVTLFMLFIAVLSLYLYRLIGCKDIVIGCPVSGRLNEEQNNLLGCFAVPVPIRLKLTDEMTFGEILCQVKQRSLEAFEHFMYPCAKVIEELKHTKDLSRPKLFSIMSGVQNNKSELMQLKFADTEIYPKEIYTAENHGARFDIAIGLDPIGSDIKFFCTYNTDLFCNYTISRMMERIENLLRLIIQQTSSPKIQNYNTISKQEEYKLILELAHGDKINLKQDSFIPLYLKQIEAAPEAIAIKTPIQTISYAMFHARVVQIASSLRQQKIGLSSKVALLLNYNSDMPAAIMAVLLLGGCYIPLSTESPRKFNSSILESIEVDAIISEKNIPIDLPNKLKTLLYLNELGCDNNKEINWPRVHADSLAYIIFTSGTTGLPKGVPITHYGLLNTLVATQHRHEISNQDNILSTTPYTFDASILVANHF